MGDRFDDRLAAAHVAQREKAVVEQRLVDARADRERLVAELARVTRVVDKEQADVDSFTFFRKLAATRAELDQEAQELAAATLQRDGVAEELRAAEIYLRQLEDRAARVCDAEIEYEVALAEKEQHVRLDPGPLGAKLAALSVIERDARAVRRQIAEAINIGQSARTAAVALEAARGSDQLGTLLGAAHRMLVLYQRECKDVLDCPLAMPVTPMRAVSALIARELAWDKLPADADPSTEIGQIIAMTDETMSVLRERDAQVERGLDRLAHDRAALLDVLAPG